MQSTNLSTIVDYAERTNLLRIHGHHGPRHDEKSTLMQAIQLMLGFRLLQPLSHRGIFQGPGWAASQRAAYSAERIFHGVNQLTVNIPWTLNVLNFFRKHMTDYSEQTLADTYVELDPWQRPQAWTEKLRPGVQKLGKHWMGTYGELLDMSACSCAARATDRSISVPGTS